MIIIFPSKSKPYKNQKFSTVKYNTMLQIRTGEMAPSFLRSAFLPEVHQEDALCL